MALVQTILQILCVLQIKQFVEDHSSGYFYGCLYPTQLIKTVSKTYL